MFKVFKTGQKGFTLIELLIVIAVIGILATVIVPNVGRFITSGKVAAGNSELAAISTSVQEYIAEHNGKISAGATLNTGGTSDIDISYIYVGNMKYAYTVGLDGMVTGISGAGSLADVDGLKWDTIAKQWARK